MSSMKVDYNRVTDTVNYYLHVKDYPDWDGLAKALRKMKLSESETQHILVSVRRGGW